MTLAHAIVGREAELAQLREVVDGSGPPNVVFVEGEAGVGKTALLEAVVADVEAWCCGRGRPTPRPAAHTPRCPTCSSR